MRIDHCESEAAVVEACRSESWPRDLRAHAEQCEVCTEVAACAMAMRDHARETADSTPLPDPGPIWWKAEIFARRDAARRAARPIALAEKAAQLAGIAVGGVLLLWRWPVIREWLAGVGALAEGAGTLVPVFQAHLLVIGSLALLPLILALSILGTSRSGD